MTMNLQCTKLSQSLLMAGWEAIRSSLLVAVTESKGMPIGQKCVLCGENDALMKCQQCGPQSFFVKTVLVFTQGLLFYMVLSYGRYVNSLVNTQ